MRPWQDIRYGTIFVTLLCVVMSLDMASAQTDPSSSWVIPNEEQLLLQDIPSVYSASKYEQKVTEAPSSVSIITADEIRKYGYRTLVDLLRSVRGFHLTYDHNYNFLGVRGFNRPGDYNSRILFLVNGHRLNDNIYDGNYIGYGFIVDVDLIDRVEIVRGPSSSLYGSNAFFGVVNVITKRGRDFQVPQIAGSGGSYDTYTTRLSYGQKFQNGLEALLSGSFFTSDGQQRLFFEEFDDPATNNGVSRNNDDEHGYSLFGKFSFGDFTLEGGHVYRKKDIPTSSFGTLFNDPRAHTLDEKSYIDLQFDHSFGTRWHILARAYYDRSYYKGDYPYDDDAGGSFLNKDSANGESFGTEVQFTTRSLSKHTLTFGAAFRYNLRQDLRNFDDMPFFEYLDDKRDSTYWALYLQDEFALFDDVTLHVGVRHDHFESFGGTTNPRLALLYTPWEPTTFKFLYGTAFRAPSTYEMFFQDGGNTQKPSSDLDPETITTYEVIVEHYFLEYLRGTATAFYYTIDDLITLQTDPADNLLVFRNANTITAYGMEAELDGKWPSGWEGRISYTYQQTEDDETDKRLTDSPSHLVKFNLIAPLLRDTLFAGLEVQYTSNRKTLSGRKTDDFILTNLTLFSQDLFLKGLSLSASIYNLFDEDYSDPGSEEHVQDSIEQDGRSFRVKLVYTF